MPNVTLSKGVAVELYAETGISTGTQLSVFNNLSTTVKLSDTLGGLDGPDFINLLGYERALNKTGVNEAWVVSFDDGFINVTEA